MRTRIREEGSLLLRHGGLVFHESQTSFARSGVEVIHRHFIVSAAEVRAWVLHTECSAVPPSEVCADWILSTVCPLVSEVFLRSQIVSVLLGSIAL